MARAFDLLLFKLSLDIQDIADYLAISRCFLSGLVDVTKDFRTLQTISIHVKKMLNISCRDTITFKGDFTKVLENEMRLRALIFPHDH